MRRNIRIIRKTRNNNKQKKKHMEKCEDNEEYKE